MSIAFGNFLNQGIFYLQGNQLLLLIHLIIPVIIKIFIYGENGKIIDRRVKGGSTRCLSMMIDSFLTTQAPKRFEIQYFTFNYIET